MQVLLYAHPGELLHRGHTAIPQWGVPWDNFTPEVMASWMYNNHGRREVFSRTGVWPILMGLYDLKSRLLAHVSVGTIEGIGDVVITRASRIAIEITSPAAQVDPGGVPVIMKKGAGGEKSPTVELLWKSDEDTTSPSASFLNEQWLDKPPHGAMAESAFWRDLFADYLERIEVELQNAIIAYSEAAIRSAERLKLLKKISS